MGRNLNRSLLTSLIFAATASLLVGCGDLAKLGLQGAIEQVGATVVVESSSDEIRAMFEAADQACPTQMDEFTTLQSVEMVNDSRVVFRYLVSEKGKKLASRLDKTAMRQAAVDHLKENAMAVAIANRDLTVEHRYVDEAGDSILFYAVNRDVLQADPSPIGVAQKNPFDVTPVSTAAVRENDDEIEETPPEELNSPALPKEASAITEEDDPSLPREVNTPVRSLDNPAGVQANPFVQQT